MINNIEGSNLDLMPSGIQRISHYNFDHFPKTPPIQAVYRDRWVINHVTSNPFTWTSSHIIERWVSFGGSDTFGYWQYEGTVKSDRVGIEFY